VRTIRTHLGRTLAALDGVTYSAPSLRRSDRTELDLAIGEVWFDMPAETRSEMGFAMSGLARIGYSSPAGDRELREAYLGRLPVAGASLPATDVDALITAGGKEALWLAVSLALEADAPECVLIPRPGWTPYDVWVRAGGSRSLTYDPIELAAHPEHLDAIVRRAEVRPGAIVLNYPNNPTGAAVTQGHMNELVECASDHGVRVISDEVYRAFSSPPASAALAPSFDPTRDMMIDSCSKWLGSAGLRIGFLVSGTSILQTLTRFRATYASCTSVVGQTLATALLQSKTANAWLDSVRAEIDATRAAMARELEDLGIPVASKGALYIWAHDPHPEGADRSERADLGERAEGARIMDGSEFGSVGGSRICVARQGLDPRRAALAVQATLKDRRHV
jgi:aspartate/methionine/tyrosine aminotransferase